MAGKDPNGYQVELDDKTVLVNTADFGMQRVVGMFAKKLEEAGLAPKDVVLVKDGVNGSKLRKEWLPEYKGGRSRATEQYKEFNELSNMFCTLVKDLGGMVIEYDGMEADDLIAYLARMLKRSEIYTYDNDLMVLGSLDGVTINGNKNPYGDFPLSFIDVYKATVGDTSDKIEGAKGFGPAAFMKVYAAFGDNGMNVLRRLIETNQLMRLEEDVATVKELKLLIDQSDKVYNCLRAAKLYPNLIEWKGKNMHIELGKINPDALVPFELSKYAYKEYIVGADNFKSVARDIQNLLGKSPYPHVSVDFETSSNDASLEWINAYPEENLFDTLGHELTTVQLTLGDNYQHSYIIGVDVKDFDNVKLSDIDFLFTAMDGYNARYIIQNANFELNVYKQHFDKWLPRIDDTKIMAGYVDENLPSGLKQSSLHYLNYEQITFEETVAIRDDFGEIILDEFGKSTMRQMKELTMDEIVRYGLDDTICTAALHQWYQFVMMIEGTVETYRTVESDAIYWVAQAYQDGMSFSVPEMSRMIQRDSEELAIAQRVFDNYLISLGWDGTVLQEATEENIQTPTFVKYAFSIFKGEPLTTMVRKPEKLYDAMEEAGATVLADLFREADVVGINQLLTAMFDGTPNFNAGSPKQKVQLMYEVMGLPVRLRGAPTANMRKAGVEGTPKTDELAIKTALKLDLDKNDETHLPKIEALEAMLKMANINTRFNLYYNKYPAYIHWKDGKIHGALHQGATVTGRFTSSKANLQQLSKSKGDFRNCFIPHKKGAVIVSLDFSAQELRMIADYSKDPEMLSCFVGDDLKDMHSLTGVGIMRNNGYDIQYPEFQAAVGDENNELHAVCTSFRKLGKNINFSTEFGALPPKLAANLIISIEEATAYRDVKLATFHVAEAWKAAVTQQAKIDGYSTTKLGRRRHLEVLLDVNADKFEQLKAERQAVNHKIQGSSAEQTKMAMGDMHRRGIRQQFDMRFLAPIHDETVFSIMIEDVPVLVPILYDCMTRQYADMEVPVVSSVAIGLNFGDGQKELGDNVVPTAENLTAFLKQHELI